MKTLKIGKKEFTVLDGNEMFVLRQTLCSVMSDVETMGFHAELILGRFNQENDYAKRRTHEDTSYIHRISAIAYEKCRRQLKDLRES